jgi:putative lipoic acid-binding regulatory protein
VSVQDEQARAHARALLEATHTFPCDYSLRVIAENQDPVTRAIVEAVGGTVRYTTQASSGGKYLSHRVEVRVASANDVLELYARVRAVAGVVTIL